jgi:hypothetical protein
MLFVILSGALLVTFAVDFLFWERRHDVEKELAVGGPGRDFVANVTVFNLAFDDRTESVTATTTVDVRPRKKDGDIRSLYYGYQSEPGGISSNVVPCTEQMKGCFTAYEDVPKSDGPHIKTAMVRLAQLPILLTQDRPEIWYPFDRYSFRFDFLGWVNTDKGEANVSFEKLTMRDSESNFILREDSDRYFLVRRPFIRIVSIVFFLLSIAFLAYLRRVGDPKELLPQSLGFFGALWGLRSILLPASVNVFPTLVDYVILIEFCFLFLIIVSKVSLTREANTSR